MVIDFDNRFLIAHTICSHVMLLFYSGGKKNKEEDVYAHHTYVAHFLQLAKAGIHVRHHGFSVS